MAWWHWEVRDKLASVAVVVSAMAFLVASGSASFTYRKLRLDEAEQRAWMGVPKVTVIAPITFDSGVMTAHLKLTFTNTGRTATDGTNSEIQFVPIEDGQDYTKKLAGTCNGMGSAPRKRGWAHNFIVPPSTEFMATVTRTYSFGKSSTIKPLLVGCIFYGLPSEEGTRIHHTSFVGVLGMKGGDVIDVIEMAPALRTDVIDIKPELVEVGGIRVVENYD